MSLNHYYFLLFPGAVSPTPSPKLKITKMCENVSNWNSKIEIGVWKGIGNHGSGNGDSGGILSNRLSLPLPLTACHRCDVCGKLLSTKLTLKRHKEQQHLQPLNNAVCNLCHKVFRTLNSLNNHKSIYHRRQKHHLYSAHPSAQNMPPHHLSQLPQQNSAKLDYI